MVGLGHSNATVLVGNESVILVDALDTDARGSCLRAMIGMDRQAGETIIYTTVIPIIGVLAPSPIRSKR